MTQQRNITGQTGEKLAADYLKKHGFKLLAQNYKTKIGEIDLLAKNNGDIVIVEVKTKSTNRFGEGFEMVNFFKRRKLLQLAKLAQIKYPDKTVRIDVVSVDLSGEKPKIEHFKNITE